MMEETHVGSFEFCEEVPEIKVSAYIQQEANWPTVGIIQIMDGAEALITLSVDEASALREALRLAIEAAKKAVEEA